MDERLSCRRSLGIAVAVVVLLGGAITAPCVQAEASGAPWDAAGSGPAPPGDITTVTNTCTNGMVIVLLSPFAVVPCAGGR
jgi:hypothetical protein